MLHVVTTAHPDGRFGSGRIESNFIEPVEIDFVIQYKHLTDAGYNVLTYDFRNHGQSGAANGGVCGVGQWEWRDCVGVKKFVDAHPALQSYLQQHPQVRQEASENPNAFMHQEERFDRREDGRDFGRDRDFNRDRDMNRGEIASMDQFLDSHPEVAEQVRKNPALLNDKKFVDAHPALQSYLQQHPQVRQEASENPNAFMHQEQHFNHQEPFGQTGKRFDHDTQRGELSSFGQFLGGHQNIAQQISKDPSLVNNAEYMQNHPELKAYLQAHPGVQEELKENPQAFMRSAQQQGGKPTPKSSALAHPEQKQY